MHVMSIITYKIDSTLKSRYRYRNSMAQITTQQSDPNGNHDSGYAPSNIEDVIAANTTTPPASPQQQQQQQHHHHHHQGATIFVNRNVHYNKTSTKNGSTAAKNTPAIAVVTPNASPKKEPTFRYDLRVLCDPFHAKLSFSH